MEVLEEVGNNHKFARAKGIGIKAQKVVWLWLFEELSEIRGGHINFNRIQRCVQQQKRIRLVARLLPKCAWAGVNKPLPPFDDNSSACGWISACGSANKEITRPRWYAHGDGETEMHFAIEVKYTLAQDTTKRKKPTVGWKTHCDKSTFYDCQEHCTALPLYWCSSAGVFALLWSSLPKALVWNPCCLKSLLAFILK